MNSFTNLDYTYGSYVRYIKVTYFKEIDFVVFEIVRDNSVQFHVIFVTSTINVERKNFELKLEFENVYHGRYIYNISDDILTFIRLTSDDLL